MFEWESNWLHLPQNEVFRWALQHMEFQRKIHIHRFGSQVLHDLQHIHQPCIRLEIRSWNYLQSMVAILEPLHSYQIQPMVCLTKRLLSDWMHLAIHTWATLSSTGIDTFFSRHLIRCFKSGCIFETNKKKTIVRLFRFVIPELRNVNLNISWSIASSFFLYVWNGKDLKISVKRLMFSIITVGLCFFSLAEYIKLNKCNCNNEKK